MATVSYIGADVDSKTVDLAVERNRRIVKRMRVKVSIAELREAIRIRPQFWRNSRNCGRRWGRFPGRGN